MDIINRIVKWIDYNRWTVAGLVLAVALSAYVMACSPKTDYRGQEVTATQLDQQVTKDKADLDARYRAWVLEGQAIEQGFVDLEADATAAANDIQEQQNFLDQIVSGAGDMIIGALMGNPVETSKVVGLASLGLGLLGVGRDRDKRRTDKVLAKVKRNLGGSLPLNEPPNPNSWQPPAPPA